VKKNILIVYQSQTGQLTDVVRHFAQPLLDCADVEVTFEEIIPQQRFPFPWPFFRFIDTFPECVYLDPPPIQPSTLTGDESFDLVIVAYQVWFLSPSLPTTAFLQSPLAAKLLKDKPVVTLIACRNMWLMAQEAVKTLLAELDARLIANVALVDEAGSAGSFLATPVWVLTGKPGPHLGGLIPRAGVSQHEIEACKRFGERISEKIRSEQPLDESLLQGLGAVQVNEKLIASEQVAKRGFRLWGKLFRALGPQGSVLRQPLVLVYAVFLVTLIVVFVPISVLFKILLAPLTRDRTAAQKQYFSWPSGQ
jgi:hypothetical protein